MFVFLSIIYIKDWLDMAAAKFMRKGYDGMQKMLGGVIGVALVLLIISVSFASLVPSKKRNSMVGHRETFVDCGSGFCAPPPSI